jgi:hypothetical protein
MCSVRVTSVLPLAQRDELERITFFNPQQNRVTERLLHSVHSYGVPKIVEDGHNLRFTVRDFGQVQSLYAMDERDGSSQLVGVALFVREPQDSLLVLHMAVHEDYTVNGPWADLWITPRLMAAVRALALRIRGVHWVRFIYPHSTQIPIRKPSLIPAPHAA